MMSQFQLVPQGASTYAISNSRQLGFPLIESRSLLPASVWPPAARTRACCSTSERNGAWAGPCSRSACPRQVRARATAASPAGPGSASASDERTRIAGAALPEAISGRHPVPGPEHGTLLQRFGPDLVREPGFVVAGAEAQGPSGICRSSNNSWVVMVG